MENKPQQTWTHPITENMRYRVGVSDGAAPAPVHATVVVDWLGEASGTSGGAEILFREYLPTAATGWMGEVIAPSKARQLRVALYYWDQIAVSAPRPWK